MPRNRIQDPPPLFEHIEINGVPYVDVHGFTVNTPSQLLSIADDARQAAAELEDRIRSAEVVAEELDAAVEADDTELDRTARVA